MEKMKDQNKIGKDFDVKFNNSDRNFIIKK